jgi:hypothetical protein
VTDMHGPVGIRQRRSDQRAFKVSHSSVFILKVIKIIDI